MRLTAGYVECSIFSVDLVTVQNEWLIDIIFNLVVNLTFAALMFTRYCHCAVNTKWSSIFYRNLVMI